MQISTHTLPNGIALTWYHPAEISASPAIILCHGFCGIQQALLPAFAEAFAQAGFSALTFDYRGFGASAGERGRLVPAMQTADITSVIDWAAAQPAIDAERMGLWGTSFGGCHVFAAAAGDARVRCIVSQLAFADGEAMVTGQMTEEEKNAFIASLLRMEEKKNASGKEMMVAVTRVLSDEESKAFFADYRLRYPAMDIKIPFLTVLETVRYQPARFAAQVQCPTLVVVAEQDTVNPPQQGIALFAAAGAATKRLYVEEGAHHYDMYDGEHFCRSLAEQLAWFNAHL
ncbi:UilS family quorum-quenching N-acyl-homoserine lactonase [Edwardsiella piscicida]|uniref:UilS family quorum-quenching N-acyl-homoserine lactonase n=1 Tax=Edwardsiella piscicida TaxID=1263550 RepID=UPI00370DCF2B